MPKPETTFTNRVHRALPPVKDFYREKMHNPYRGGTADYWYSGRAADLWVEYKYLPKTPVRSAVSASLSELQRLWLDGRCTEGRNVWVVIGHPGGAVVLKNKRWNDILSAEDFKKLTVPVKELAQLLLTSCHGIHHDQITTRHLSPDREGSKRV